MQVPDYFIDKNCIHTTNKKISVTRYSEYVPSKIYTEVNENLLVIVLKGAKRLVYNNYETVVNEGQFAFFRKGNYIMNQIINNNKYESLLLFISDDILSNLPKSEITYSMSLCIPFYKKNMVPFMYDEANSLLKLLEADSKDYDEILNLKVIELLMYIQTSDKIGDFAKFLQGCSKKDNMESFLEHNYDRIDDIASLAKHLNISVSTFKRKFAKIYNCTPHQWINAKKLEQSEMLLKTSNYSVTDICFLSGFESMSSFMALFKKKNGLSPGKYRNKLIQSENI